MKDADSSYIEKDTVINNKTYHKLIKYDFGFQKKIINCLRDSLHYIVSSNGTVFFSSQDFITTFNSGYNISSMNDTILYFETKMADRDSVVDVPAGSFKTSAMRTTFNLRAAYAPEELRVRSKYNRYSKNVGLVSETEDFYAIYAFYREKRLVRYHLN